MITLFSIISLNDIDVKKKQKVCRKILLVKSLESFFKNCISGSCQSLVQYISDANFSHCALQDLLHRLSTSSF